VGKDHDSSILGSGSKADPKQSSGDAAAEACPALSHCLQLDSENVHQNATITRTIVIAARAVGILLVTNPFCLIIFFPYPPPLNSRVFIARSVASVASVASQKAKTKNIKKTPSFV
jgi:hypothetical protein